MWLVIKCDMHIVHVVYPFTFSRHRNNGTNRSLDCTFLCVGKGWALTYVRAVPRGIYTCMYTSTYMRAKPHVIFIWIIIHELQSAVKFLVVSGILSLMYRLYGRMHIRTVHVLVKLSAYICRINMQPVQCTKVHIAHDATWTPESEWTI